MKAKGMLAVLAVTTAVSVSQGAIHTTTGQGGSLADPSTWNNQSVPAEGETDLQMRLLVAEDGVAYVNDLPFVPLLAAFDFTGVISKYPDASHATLSGGAMRVLRNGYSGGFGIADSTPTGFVGEVSAPLVAAYPHVYFKVPAGRTLILSGPLTHEPVDKQYYPSGVTADLWTTNCFRFNGQGTNVIRGVYHVDVAVSYATAYAATLFENGTTIVENEMYLPRFTISSCTFVVGPGGKVANWSSPAVIGNATVDIAGGLWKTKQSVYWGSSSSGIVKVRVRDSGCWYTYDTEQLGKDGLTDISVEDGGSLYLRSIHYQGFSQNGSTHLTVSGGLVKEGVDAIYLGSYGNTAADNWLCLKGGETWASHLSQRARSDAVGKNNDVKFYGDGGTLVATVANKLTTANTLDPFVTGDATKFHAYARAGGLVVDTMRNTVNFNAAIAGNDDAQKADGGVVKLGTGTLKLSVACTYAGTNEVRCGTLELAAANAAPLTKVGAGATLKIDDPAFYAQAVRLETAGRLAFAGSALSLSALSAADGGVLVLTPGAQAVTLGATPELDGALAFELTGAVANGTYSLLTVASAETVAMKCRVSNPVAGKAYAFSAADGQVKVTVADAMGVSAWNAAGGGAWTSSDSWAGDVPNAAGAQATFGSVLASAATITVDADVTVGTLLVDGAANLTFAGSGALTFAGNGATALLEVKSGSHTLSADVKVVGETVLRVASGATLSVNDLVADGAAAFVRICGAGTVSVAGTCDVPILVSETAILKLGEGAKLMKDVTVGDGATLNVAGNAEVVGNLNLPVGAICQTAAGKALVQDEAPEMVSVYYQSASSPTRAFRDLSALKTAKLRYATLAYAGDEAGTFSGDILVAGIGANYASALRRLPGAGDLAFTGSVVAGDSSSGFRVQGDMDGEISLSGDWISAAIDTYFRLGGGRIRLADGFIFNGSRDVAGGFRLGGDTGEKTSVEMESGVTINAYDLSVSPEARAAGADVSFTQKGGSVVLRNGLAVGSLASSSPKTLRMEGGSFQTAPTAWTRFLYGPSSLMIAGGEMALGNLVFGETGNATASYEITTAPLSAGSTDIVVSNGVLAVSGEFDLSGDSSGHRYNRLTAETDGIVSTPAAIRTAPGDGLVNGGAYTALGLDGGVFRLTGVGTDVASSLADYFPALGAIALGVNGGTVDTCGNAVTINAPLRAVAANGTFVKDGTGTLTVSGKSVVRGGLDVRQGTLSIGLASDKMRNFGDGLVAYWDFDGDDPLADKSGYGHDLFQMNANSSVDFTETNAFDGKSASWGTRTWAWLGAFTNANEKLIVNEFTVSLFVRLDCWDKLYASDKASTIFAAKVQPQKTKSDVSSADSLVVTGPNTFASDFDQQNVMSGVDVSSVFDLGTWHALTYVRRGGEISFYVDGTLVRRNSTTTPSRGLFDFLNAENGEDSCRMLSFGRGTWSQNCAVKNMMLDDIAIHRRALTDAEIAQYYADRGTVPTPDVTVADGATLDLRGGAVSAPTLAGAGTVNGGVTVLEKLVADPEGPVHVKDLAFGENGTVDLAFADGEKAKSRYAQVIATFDTLAADAEAVLRTWTVTGFGRDGSTGYRGRLSVDRTAQTVTATIEGPGFIMIVQ